MDIYSIITSVTGTAFLILLSIVAFFLKKSLSVIEKKFENMQKSVDEVYSENEVIRNNYLTRFEKVYKMMSENTRNNLESFEQIRADIAETRHKLGNQLQLIINNNSEIYSKKSDCLVHSHMFSKLTDDIGTLKLEMVVVKEKLSHLPIKDM